MTLEENLFYSRRSPALEENLIYSRRLPALGSVSELLGSLDG